MYIIGITGGTASGKTTFVSKLKEKIDPNYINIISQDDYYKPLAHLSASEKATVNFDHPNAIDFELLARHIIALKNNTPILKPMYDFEIHDRLEAKKIVTPKPILVIEGILILTSEKIKALCDYAIFVDAPKKIRQKRRIDRDISERGRTLESVLYQFENHIHPMHDQFIEPVKTSVHRIIDGTISFDKPLEELVNLIENQVSLP